ncbi:unnamed protein product, partial [Mesorhabditis spiculigera]
MRHKWMRQSSVYLFNVSTLLFLLLRYVFADEGGLEIPKDAKFRPRVPNKTVARYANGSLNYADIPENRCFCTYGHEEGVCDKNETCIRHPQAACYHAVELIYDKKLSTMVHWHKYGCATAERGSGASHLTCRQSRQHHHKVIGCCYEGNYCNRDLNVTLHFYEEEALEFPSFEDSAWLWIVLLGLLVLSVLMLSLVGVYTFYRKYKQPKRRKSLLDEEPMLDGEESGGSGSGMSSLNQRTVAKDLNIIKVIDQGRYGKVRKATYRGSFVAVKTFNTTEEDSWKNERDVYQTQMLNHESILQFVAADIFSEDTITQMLLITNYHELGSLCDYLRRVDVILDTKEALELVYSSICGIDHLHNSVLGTGSRRKPEIAHRDLKSKNIIVKRPGFCCIADFGLAVRLEGDKLIPERVNIQVGTKRYMAPEVLSKQLNTRDFVQFKRADIYSFALVIWEVMRRIELDTLSEGSDIDRKFSASGKDSTLGSSGQSTHGSGDEGQEPSDSGVVLEGKWNTSSMKCHPYAPPYEGLVRSDPSFEEMRQLVCDQGVRPPVDNGWLDPANKELYEMATVMRDCWHANPRCRYTALKVKKSMGALLQSLQPNQETVHSLSKCSYKKEADSGIGSNSKSSNSHSKGSGSGTRLHGQDGIVVLE